MKQEICKCGEYKGAHIDGLCPSAKDYGKKFEPQEEWMEHSTEPCEFKDCPCHESETKKGCGKEWKMWNPETEEYMHYGKCRTDILCPKCDKPKNHSQEVARVCIPNKNHNEYIREWNKKNPDKVRRTVKNYRSKNQEKQPAWDKARRGIGAIKIEGLCQICKVEKAKLRHHKDYSKPREVILICVKCHKNIHANSQQEDCVCGNTEQHAWFHSVNKCDGTNATPGGVKPTDFNLKENFIAWRCGIENDTWKCGDHFRYTKEDGDRLEETHKEFIKRLKEDVDLAISAHGNYCPDTLKHIRKQIDKLSGGLGE